MAKNDDEPAFPSVDYGTTGMSLRDWFAGQALAGVLSNATLQIHSENQTAVLAEGMYQIADAMLAERQREDGNGC